MTKEQLQKIIDQFSEEDLKKSGIFGINQFGSSSDESFIRSNKEGLELFALELLKAARDTEVVLTNPGKNIIPLNHEEDWVDESSQTLIQFVEPIAERQVLKPKAEQKSTFADKIIPYGCGFVAIILLVATVIGFITLAKWVF